MSESVEQVSSSNSSKKSQSFGRSKSADARQWRLQYGKRPPQKTDTERQQEQDLIEAFLKDRKDDPPVEVAHPQPASKSSKSHARKDQELVAKFFKKRVTLTPGE